MNRARKGLGETTIRRYRRESPAFEKAYQREHAALLDETISGLQTASIAAVATLTKALEAGNVEDRIRSARAILSFTLQGVKAQREISYQDELEERLERYEEAEKAKAKASSSGRNGHFIR